MPRKSKTAPEKEVIDTYSAALRDLNKNDPKKIPEFMRKFKEAFDNALEEGVDDHQTVALMEAKAMTGSNINYRLLKLAQILPTTNNPDEVGRTLANMVKVILSRVPHDPHDAYANIRKKLFTMSVADISGKQLPATAGYGQALTLVKTMLNGYDATFIMKVLSSIAKYLH